MVTEDTHKLLKTAEILQALFILAVFAYLDILTRFPPPPPLQFGSDRLQLITIILAILSVVALVYSYFLPRLMIKGYKTAVRKAPIAPIKSRLFSIFIARSASLEAIAIWGFILGIIGARLDSVVPFFIVSVVGLIIVFPTESKWNKLAAMLEPPVDENHS